MIVVYKLPPKPIMKGAEHHSSHLPYHLFLSDLTHNEIPSLGCCHSLGCVRSGK